MGEVLKDKYGNKLGEIVQEGRYLVIKDRYGNKLGSYDGQYTRDKYGNILYQGNMLARLIP